MQETRPLRHRSRGVALAVLAGALVVFATLPRAQAFPGLAGLIAYESSLKGRSDIFTVRADGSDTPRQLTRTAACESQPAWSPDGTRIAFERRALCASRASADIWVMNGDGSGARPLVRSPGFDGNPSWAPDGSRIVFESNRLGGDSDIWVVNADRTGAKNLTSFWSRDDSDPSWSPGGRKIAFVTDRDGDSEIYLMNPDGTNPFRLTTSGGADVSPGWAPSGEFVVFASDREGTFDIYIANDRFLLRRLTTSTTRDEMPTWSPDGKQIVYVSSGRSSTSDLWVMNADGSKVTRVTTAGASERAPDWQAAPRR